MTKGALNKVLEDLVSSNELTIYVEGWVRYKEKQREGTVAFL